MQVTMLIWEYIRTLQRLNTSVSLFTLWYVLVLSCSCRWLQQQLWPVTETRAVWPRGFYQWTRVLLSSKRTDWLFCKHNLLIHTKENISIKKENYSPGRKAEDYVISRVQRFSCLVVGSCVVSKDLISLLYLPSTPEGRIMLSDNWHMTPAESPLCSVGVTHYFQISHFWFSS